MLTNIAFLSIDYVSVTFLRNTGRQRTCGKHLVSQASKKSSKVD